jgi:hypothetical protein
VGDDNEVVAAHPRGTGPPRVAEPGAEEVPVLTLGDQRCWRIRQTLDGDGRCAGLRAQTTGQAYEIALVSRLALAERMPELADIGGNLRSMTT